MRKLFAIVLILLLIISNSLILAETEDMELPKLIKFEFDKSNLKPIPENPKNNYSPIASGFSDDGLSYHDDSLDIKAYKIRRYDTDIAVAFVQIADVHQLKTELARPYPSQSTMRVSMVSERVKAIFASNGDWFTYHNYGIIYRNGKQLRNRENKDYDGLIIDTKGDFHIVKPMTEEAFAKINADVYQSFAFGPALIIDGVIQDFSARKVTNAQRTAIGQIDTLSYVFVSSNSKDQKGSLGLTVDQLAKLMYDLGATTAYNLDGGQSSSMVLNHIKINGLSPKNQRAVGDIIYFTTAVSN